MCGRFGASFQYRNIKVLWNLRGDLPEFGPRYNIAPSQEVLVIVRNEGRNELKQMHWGLGAVVGARPLNWSAYDQCSRGNPASKALVQESRGESALPCSG
jgi:putative SOS response-associated peptidase YedK